MCYRRRSLPPWKARIQLGIHKEDIVWVIDGLIDIFLSGSFKAFESNDWVNWGVSGVGGKGVGRVLFERDSSKMTR